MNRIHSLVFLQHNCGHCLSPAYLIILTLRNVLLSLGNFVADKRTNKQISKLQTLNEFTICLPQGHKLNVFDVSPAACAAVESSGGNVLKSPEAVAENSDYVITMLPNNDIVYETYKTITRSKINSKTIFIDSSTIDPNVAKKVSKIVGHHKN